MCVRVCASRPTRLDVPPPDRLSGLRTESIVCVCLLVRRSLPLSLHHTIICMSVSLSVCFAFWAGSVNPAATVAVLGTGIGLLFIVKTMIMFIMDMTIYTIFYYLQTNLLRKYASQI